MNRYFLLRMTALSACVLSLSLISQGSLLAGTPPSLLETGYHDMYDLRFDAAHHAFGEWQRLHPEDPLGPTSDAAAYLFSEFDRLGILQSQFFLDDNNFKKPASRAADPAMKLAFENDLAKSRRLAGSILARSPQNRSALLARVLSLGLQADYLALIENRELASLHYMKRAATAAKKLLEIDPACYDAYLAAGVENYLLSFNPAPVRWMLQLYGVETNKALGIQELRLTAEKGHYLQPYARLLLAIAAMRSQSRSEAARLLGGLAREFPDNRLYTTELARLQGYSPRGS